MLILRKVLFWVFAITYVVLCPLIILHALGFSWHRGPEKQKELMQTGLVYVDTRPVRAQVDFSGLEKSLMTPASIRNLFPGQYEVTVTGEGYAPWHRSVTVEAAKAVVLKHILLTPTHREEKVLTDYSVRQMYPVRGSRFLPFACGDKLEDWLCLDVRNDELVPLVPTNFPQSSGRVNRVFTVPKGEHVAMEVETDGRQHYVWCDLNPDRETIRDITMLLPLGLDELTWNPDQPNRIFVRRGNVLDRLDVKRGALYPQMATNVEAFALKDGRLYGRTPEWAYFSMEPEDREVEEWIPETDREARLWAAEVSSNEVAQTFRVFDAAYQLRREDAQIVLVEIEFPAPRQTQAVVTVKSQTDVLYIEARGLLYYIRASDGFLVSTELVPDRPLLSMPHLEQDAVYRQGSEVAP